jgi:hypothetical protein
MPLGTAREPQLDDTSNCSGAGRKGFKRTFVSTNRAALMKLVARRPPVSVVEERCT